MTKIQLSLINFPHHEILSSILNDFSNDFEFTADGVFRRIIPPLCPNCGFPMSHNGFNTYRKRLLGEADVGRYLCGACGKSVEEDRTFWNNLKAGFLDIITEICLRLRLNHASYELIEQIMSFIQIIIIHFFAVFPREIYPPADCANAMAGCPSRTANASFFGNQRQRSANFIYRCV